jgi:hypothetical protein
MQWTSTGSPTQALADSFLAAGTVLLVVCREQLLQLPHNSAAFSLLQDRGLHPAYQGLAQQMQAGSGGTTNTVANRLTACLSQLAHWCPLFGELPPAPCTDNVAPHSQLYAPPRCKRVALSAACSPQFFSVSDQVCLRRSSWNSPITFRAS